MFIARCGATVFVVKQFIVCVPIYFLVAASAGAAGPLTLSEAEALALHDEPGQARLQAQSDAVAEKAVAGGQLADPRMRAGLMNLPIESGGFTTEGMSQVQFGVRQAFPPGRTLQWRTAQLERKAQALALLSNSRKRDVIAAVRHAWLGVYYWTHAREIVSANRPLFSDLVDVTRALYTVGRRNQQDLMQAELERSRIDDRLLMIDQSIGEARSELARWIGSDPAQRAVGPALPEWDDAPGLVELQHNLQSFPALTAATQEVAAGEAGINLAEQRYKPGWALDVGYGYRDGRLPGGGSRSDFLSVMVSVDLPVFRNKRQDRILAAAQSERRASLHAKTELHRVLLQQLQSAYRRWTDTGARLELYEQTMLAQAAGQSRAALKAYQSDAATFSDVMRALTGELEVRLDHHRLQVDRDRNYVALAKLGGLL